MGHIVSRNGVSRAACRLGAGRELIRFSFLVLAKALVLCAVVGCAGPQQVTVREAYKIPRPHHALLQTHAKPKCDLGAPSKLPVKAKVEDTWTPYSGKPENRPENEPDAQPSPEAVDHAKTYDLLSKERNCYQQAEAKVRKKLHSLQSSVGSTLIALQQETTVRAPVQE